MISMKRMINKKISIPLPQSKINKLLMKNHLKEITMSIKHPILSLNQDLEDWILVFKFKEEISSISILKLDH